MTDPIGIPSPPQLPAVNAAGAVPQPLDAMTSAEKQSFLWQTHSYLAEYARFADTKAAFAGTIAGALIGCLFSAGLFAPLVRTPIRNWAFVSWASGIGGLLLSGCVALAICVVYPRLRWHGRSGFIFWRAVTAHGSAERFTEAFSGGTQEDLIQELAGQVFAVSKYVCTPKYRNVSYSLLCLGAGALFAALALLSR
jgi:hypothetical protein